ncbi:unnamed protein product, partial [Polarella glacialis]
FRCESCDADCSYPSRPADRSQNTGGSSASTSRLRLESHERWEFDDSRQMQRLVRLVGLCNLCHEATHMKLADSRGRGEAARRQLAAVTGMSSEDSEAHVQEAYRLWELRSQKQWSLDLSLLTESVFQLLHVPDKAEREQLALEGLARDKERQQESE